MWVCPACANIPANPDARFCERCGTALVEPQPSEEIEVLPDEFDTNLSLPTVASIAGDVQDFMQTNEIGAVRPQLDYAEREPQSVKAVNRSDAQMRAVASEPVDAKAWKVWEGIHPMPGRLRVSGRDWRCIAGLDVADPASAAKFHFEVRDAEVVVRESGEGTYPRGAKVAGRGIRHQGGCVALTLDGLLPGAPLVIVRQCLAIGVEVAEVTLGESDDVVAEIRAHEVDGETVWRNRTVVIEALDVMSPSLDVRVWDTGSNPGVTWFNVWFYQPV